ncbi:CLUMA_CG003793, isoform A [Clunio marinus]|uniref:CLUMA_CG003793, isoform A n=1 Tax=Clunio marinus TaxID=568069 RepID=A0A1J1HRB1_9DIPT|nr:CLUMA_CG003793, isoform A [Clunio marinus]
MKCKSETTLRATHEMEQNMKQSSCLFDSTTKCVHDCAQSATLDITLFTFEASHYIDISIVFNLRCCLVFSEVND